MPPGFVRDLRGTGSPGCADVCASGCTDLRLRDPGMVGAVTNAVFDLPRTGLTEGVSARDFADSGRSSDRRAAVSAPRLGRESGGGADLGPAPSALPREAATPASFVEGPSFARRLAKAARMAGDGAGGKSSPGKPPVSDTPASEVRPATSGKACAPVTSGANVFGDGAGAASCGTGSLAGAVAPYWLSGGRAASGALAADGSSGQVAGGGLAGAASGTGVATGLADDKTSALSGDAISGLSLSTRALTALSALRSEVDFPAPGCDFGKSRAAI